MIFSYCENIIGPYPCIQGTLSILIGSVGQAQGLPIITQDYWTSTGGAMSQLVALLSVTALALVEYVLIGIFDPLAGLSAERKEAIARMN